MKPVVALSALFLVGALVIVGGAVAQGRDGATPRAPAPVIRIAELEIDPAQLDAYKAALAEEVEASVRLEPGVLALNAVSLDDNPAHIRLLEVYASQLAYEAHLKAPHFLKYKISTADMVKSLKLISTKPVKLCGKAEFSEEGAPRCL